MPTAPDDAPSPATSDGAPRWGLGDVAAAITFGYAAASIASAAALAATGREPDAADDLPLGFMLLTSGALWLGFVGVPWLATRWKGRGLVEDLHLHGRWSDAWVGGGVGAALQLVVLPLLYWPFLQLFDKGMSDLEEPARELADRADSPVTVALLVLIVGIGAPVAEEILWRGLFQRSLLKRGVHPVLSIGIVAVAFGAIHGQVLQLPALVIFGAAAGWLAYRYDRLGPAIAAHMAFNMVTVVALVAR